MKRILLTLGGLGVALGLLAACGGGQPTADEVLSQASDTMAAVESLQFIIEREGDPIPITAGMLSAAILGAEGVYQSPDSVYATVKVSAQGVVAEAEFLWNADGVFFKLPPLVAAFTPVDLQETFNATDIFQADVGLPRILKELEAPEFGEEEDIEGVEAYHITAEADGSELSALVGGAVEPGPATLDVFVDKETSEVVRVVITEASGGRWLIDFFAFGEPVEIPTP